MYNTRFVQQVVDWERRMQIENEKKGSPQIDKYALLPHAAEPVRKEEKLILEEFFATLKATPFVSTFLD
jgi:hypothetical protein